MDVVFAAAFGEFQRRHLADHGGAPVLHERQRVLFAAQRLALVARASAKLGDDPELALAEVEESDPERVLRHMERTLAQSYPLLRRARWLRLLHDSAVLYREPLDARTRLLVVCDGDVVEARDADLEERVTPPNRSAEPAFNRAKYDRLRILTTELKRLLRDGGVVAVHVRRGRRLSGQVLEGILRSV